MNNNHLHNNLIQQISSLQVVSNNPTTSFQIRTNILNGSTKGLLIQCSVNDLLSIKFYINNLLRFDYNSVLIHTSCLRISENLIYFPFNDNLDFLDTELLSYSGSINFSTLQDSRLCLLFSSEQPKVIVHNVYFNHFRQYNGLGGLHIANRSTFINDTTFNHPVESIVGIAPSTNIFDMSGNVIPFITNASGSTGSTGSTVSTGSTGPPVSYVFPWSSGPSESSGPSGPYTVPLGRLSIKLITSEQSICNISHENIVEGSRYMTCLVCNNNFFERNIKQWLQSATNTRRTCPLCRSVWTNFDIYINLPPSIELD